jgi:DNA-binding transcriptional ArsR family regulator
MGWLDFLRRKPEKRPASPKPEIQKKMHAAAMTTTVQKRPRQKPKLEHAVLREWSTDLQKLQQHPLTQAKIVNEKLLAIVVDALNEINAKLDELSTRMAKIETQKVRVIEREKPKVKLSSGDQKVLDFIKKKKQAQAGEVAKNLKISRPNAALKLSKLFSIGQLEKEQEGKDVYYKLA